MVSYLYEVDQMLVPQPLEHANLPESNLLNGGIILGLQELLDGHQLHSKHTCQ